MDAFLGKVESVDVFPEFCEIFHSNYFMELIKMAASSKQTNFYLVYLKTKQHDLIRKQRYFKIPPF